MQKILAGLGVFLGVVASASPVQAHYYSPVFKTPLPMAPDACGPGFIYICPNGTAYGPNYWLRPPGLPFNGHLPGPQGQAIMAGWGHPQSGWGHSQPGGQPGWGHPRPQPGFPSHMGAPGHMPTHTPSLPNPGYALPPMPLPVPGYQLPNQPLPNPGYAPPTQPQGHGFYTNPYVRSPRDFFMWTEFMEDQIARERRPSVVP